MFGVWETLRFPGVSDILRFCFSPCFVFCLTVLGWSGKNFEKNKQVWTYGEVLRRSWTGDMGSEFFPHCFLFFCIFSINQMKLKAMTPRQYWLWSWLWRDDGRFSSSCCGVFPVIFCSHQRSTVFAHAVFNVFWNLLVLVDIAPACGQEPFWARKKFWCERSI
jgi:hypothetical protein